MLNGSSRGKAATVLTLACGRTLRVDEKVRTNDWPDILLEQWSDEGRRSPGRVQKPLACDLIASTSQQFGELEPGQRGRALLSAPASPMVP